MTDREAKVFCCGVEPERLYKDLLSVEDSLRRGLLYAKEYHEADKGLTFRLEQIIQQLENVIDGIESARIMAAEGDGEAEQLPDINL
jgi:molecular chaperone GrpE (heat shock protein)